MRYLIILVLFLHLHANKKQEMFYLYQKEKYQQACNIGFNNFKNYKRDEEFVSLYSFSCLKSDYIDRLSVSIATLKFSKEARANASYFSVILMQKKLLYHAMLDKYSIANLNLPKTDYVLSKVFNSYTKLGEHSPKLFYLFEDENDPRMKYKLYLRKGNRVDKMIIEEIYDSISVKKHIYW